MAIAALVASACGSSSSSSGGGGGTTGGVGGGVGGGTGGVGGGGGGGAGGGTGGGTGGVGGGTGGSGGGGGGGGSGGISQGVVTLNQTATVAGTLTYYSSQATARFTVASASASCVTSLVSGCTLEECSVSADAGTITPLAPQSAGVITLTGPSLKLADGGVLALAFGDGGYAGIATGTKFWSSGDTLVLAAAGATVPAFSGKTVTAPTDLTLMAPTCASFNCGALSRSANLTVSWTGGTSSDVHVVLASLSATKTVSVACKFITSPATVDGVLMAKLNKSGPGVTNIFVVSPSNTTSFTAGTFSVTFVAVGGGAAGGFVTSN